MGQILLSCSKANRKEKVLYFAPQGKNRQPDFSSNPWDNQKPVREGRVE